ncbi:MULTISPECIES: translation initiation factor IF-2 [Methylomonas]|uniref:Translation initiation factor IF-2 n=2 Tax=Methylomonas TaxID=416 RepID=A0A126T852_9GAMM|nr:MULTISPECIES: translation initiation factor IF-2 [Methylomonas]AMK78228.1 translation initiation factor IF-2 [Methylomonas denitrificans]OAI03946.1 translation initiation factor IF-2 [Methylomonas methanica]TCV87744.1 translation initiation factor 2 (bIF-2) [Methylomonas methanica]
MSDKTVQELAEVVGIPLERFLEQLKEAGLTASEPDDVINDEEKVKLLAHLRKRHGKSEADQEAAAPKRITLKRSTKTELKQSTPPGTAVKTVSVEVRKQKTYIKRSDASSGNDELRQAELAKQALEEQRRQQAIEEEKRKHLHEQKSVQAAHEEQVVGQEAVKPGEVSAPAVTATAEPVAAERQATEELPVVAEAQPAVIAKVEAPAPSVVPEMTEEQRLEKEKKERLEAAVQRTAEKVKQKAEAKQQQTTLHKKKAEFKPTRGPATDGDIGGGGDAARRGGKGKKGKAPSRREKPEFEIDVNQARHKFEKPVAPTVYDVTIPETIVVSDLAAKMNIKAAEVIKHLMRLGIMSTINQTIDQETAVILVEEMGHKAIMQSEDDFEQEMLAEVQGESDERKVQLRAPIVTIMGHVDHGKTSLLDYIRKTRVAAGEAGGITQHIGAYQVKTDHGAVTFLDTPGHAAFTAMRARGAEVTDIVIVVVAADDGVMPQTKEAIDHARAANVPIIVALNKIDKPEANPDRVMQELATLNVVPEEWGGDVQFLKVSAKVGTGIDELIEALIVQAEVLELKAPVDGIASGICIESRLDRGRGAVATILIQKGTLSKGEFVLCGHEYGRIRAMFDENAHAIKSAGPSMPVEILGLSGTPDAGDEFLVVQNERVARELAAHREDRKRSNRHAAQHASKLDDVFSRMSAGETSTLNVVIKTDVQGSLEALRESLVGLSTEEVQVKCIFGGVGGINEGDANLALASSAILIGFNVRADAVARKLIEEKDIDLHYYSIIYEAIDEVKRAISGMLAPEIQEKIVGLAEVRDVFRSPKFGAVAGCMVIDGFVKRNLPIRVLRNNVVIYEGQLESLRRFKDDVNEVKMGMECGIGVKNYNDVQNGDQIEVFERIEVRREI